MKDAEFYIFYMVKSANKNLKKKEIRRKGYYLCRQTKSNRNFG